LPRLCRARHRRGRVRHIRAGESRRAGRFLQRRAIADTIAAARKHAEAAEAALAPFPDSEFKRALAALPEFVVERAY
jgi:geranylgeranyl pyrophosphate synthase